MSAIFRSSRRVSIRSFCSQSQTPALTIGFGFASVLVGVSAAAGFAATYAYSTDEFENKARKLRSLATHKVGGEASALEKFQALMFSSAMAVPARASELYLDLKRWVQEPLSDELLPDMQPTEEGKFTLVLDLVGTLVSSDWKRGRGWRTYKRPGLDIFLEHLAEFYEIVVYSDERQDVVDKVIANLDKNQCIRYSLARGATKYQDREHYRDLSKLNRDPAKIIYVSAYALETCLQPQNNLQIKSWKLETDDTELVCIIPFLLALATCKPPDVRIILSNFQGEDVTKQCIIRQSQEQQKQRR